jgi:hypothetical protein
MGCICGPSVANLFVYILERKWLSLNPDLIYYRFIDDIFIASFGDIDLIIFKSQFVYLKLNIESGNVVNFLDLNISFDSIIGRFRFSLYIKPTNTFSYLLPSSNHPKHIFRNIPNSLFKRIRRICSSYIDYLHFSRLLFIQLVKRDYKPTILSGIIRNVGKINRESLLPYNTKNINILCNNSIKLFLEYDINNDIFRNYLYNTFLNLSNKFDFLKHHKLFIINKVKTNIGSLMIHGFKQNQTKKCFYKKCEDINCLVCIYSSNFYFIKINDLFLPIRNNSSCDSVGIIYIICCFKCNYFYIGESGRTVKDRIYEHLRNIKNFNYNIINSLININDTCIAEHFNKKGHNLLIDFKFCIFESKVTNTEIRKSIETDLINLFKLFNINILNNKFKQPNRNKISYLTFQT